jgi:hypothetical protein
VEKQKAEEKGVEFVQQLHTLRGRAFGKVDKEGILDSDNAWVHHLEVVLKGFENKQVMAKVNDVNTQNPTELYDVTTPAEETLNRNLRFGYIQGTVDTRAIMGLSQPGQNVAQMAPYGRIILGLLPAPTWSSVLLVQEAKSQATGLSYLKQKGSKVQRIGGKLAANPCCYSSYCPQFS